MKNSTTATFPLVTTNSVTVTMMFLYRPYQYVKYSYMFLDRQVLLHDSASNRSHCFTINYQPDKSVCEEHIKINL